MRFYAHASHRLQKILIVWLFFSCFQKILCFCHVYNEPESPSYFWIDTLSPSASTAANSRLHSTALANFERLVRTRLIDEYAGRQPAPVVPGQVPVVLPLADRKEWAPFNYVGQYARSNFVPIVNANQHSWFEPTPRCMKCRVIHDYTILGEDLQIKAVPNQSCQRAEDIFHGKLRQLKKVDNVVLANL